MTSMIDENSPSIAVAILAGGKSKRMGRDKIALSLHGEPVLFTVLRKLSMMFPQILISVADSRGFCRRLEYFAVWRKFLPCCEEACGCPKLNFPGIEHCNILCVADIIPCNGILGGLYSVLEYSECDVVLVLGLDMPFLAPQIIADLKCHAVKGKIVIPKVAGHYEPLLALYPKELAEQCREHIALGRMKLSDLCAPHRTIEITPEDFSSPDLLRRSTVNINYPKDLMLLSSEDIGYSEDDVSSDGSGVFS